MAPISGPENGTDSRPALEAQGGKKKLRPGRETQAVLLQFPRISPPQIWQLRFFFIF